MSDSDTGLAYGAGVTYDLSKTTYLNADYTKYYDRDDQKLEGNRDIFYGASRVEQVSNCVPDLDYLEKDVITGEQRYHFSFAFPDQSRNCQAALSSGSIADPRGFVKGMLDFTPGGNFEGGARELAWLKAKWLNDEYRPVRTVRSLPFLGYDEETGTYCFPEFGFQGGRELQVNSHGFIEPTCKF